VDLNKLSTADKVIAASGILLFIFSFFSWFAVDVGFGIRAASANGWDVGFLWGGIPALLGLLLAALVLVPLFAADFKLPDLPVTWGQAILGAAALAAFLVVLRLLMGFHSWDRQIGIFLAALAAIGLAVGGFLKFQEEKAGTTAAPPSAF
jgi:hypothetical protein